MCGGGRGGGGGGVARGGKKDLKCLLLRFLPCMRTIKTLVLSYLGVVGWCEGVMYLVSPGCPTDIGLQLGKACYC